jgi:hypothetical protein
VIEPGAENRIMVVVTNVLDWGTIPPGYVEETPEGPRQRLLFDFFNYAGLNRTVWLYTTPASYVDDIAAVTDLDGPTGIVRYVVEAAGDGEVRVTLRDGECTEVAQAAGAPASCPSRTCIRGDRARATSTSSASSSGATGRADRRVPVAARHPDRRGRRRPLSHQR